MAFLGLNVIFIFKCKRHYRSHLLRQILDKTMDSIMFLIYMQCTPHAVSLQIATFGHAKWQFGHAKLQFRQSGN